MNFLKKAFGNNVPPERRFEGKVAVVTGASAGIGLATALAFAREGAKVALIARREAEGAKALERVEAAGTEGLFARADVGDAAQVAAAFDLIQKRFGRVDAAVNNAGLQQRSAPLASIEEAEFDRVMGVNVKGMWLCMRREIALMQGRGGAIVNMSSIWGIKPHPEFGAYATSKHAVIGMTKVAALDYVGQGIRINAVCPGFVRTPMTERVDEEWLKKRIPLRRWIEADEIAQAVLFLCSDAAASIIGEALVVDGGASIRSW